ncbi:MAG: OmpA family protein [Desulfosalsimonas sp.]|uniref:OmpA family protein n=1 Tax=Desulfosalsimonas sp. TaxID=3073848 RepID=UPI00397082A8
MRPIVKTAVIILSAIFVTSLAGETFAQNKTKIEPKAENFVFLVDNSGSMGFDYKPLEMPKSQAARDLLIAVSQDLPELEAGFGVYTYGPYKKYLPAGTQGHQGLKGSFEAMPVEFPIFDRQTPMGQDLKSLNNEVSRLEDRINVIVATDGESNRGPDPVGVLQEIDDKYGDRVCFHFLSLAQSPEEKALVNQMARVQSCSTTTEAHTLAEDAGRQAFIEKVFYETRQVKAEPEPEPKEKPAEKAPVIGNVLFDFDSSQIKSQYKKDLDKAVEIIKAHPGKEIILKGHTDSKGSAEYNMKLSKQRANAVADYLKEQGVDPNRLEEEIEAYGEANPEYDNATESGRALNRRVEIKLVK